MKIFNEDMYDALVTPWESISFGLLWFHLEFLEDNTIYFIGSLYCELIRCTFVNRCFDIFSYIYLKLNENESYVFNIPCINYGLLTYLKKKKKEKKFSKMSSNSVGHPHLVTYTSCVGRYAMTSSVGQVTNMKANQVSNKY